MSKEPNVVQRRAMQIYAELLDESRGRIIVLEGILAGKVNLPGPILSELCFLQLRMLCELIALGCLVVHGDLSGAQSKRLRKQYRADEIMRRLADLHSDFYPVPHVQQTQNGHAHFEPMSDDYLTKADLSKLYGKCGDELHRGALKDILKSSQLKTPQENQTVRAEVNLHVRNVARLLNQHRIPLFDASTMLWAVIASIDQGGRAEVLFASADDRSKTIALVHKTRGRY